MKKNNKKVIAIVFIAIAVLFIVIGFVMQGYILKSNKENINNIELTEKEQKVEDFIQNNIFNENQSAETISKNLNSTILISDVMYGKNSIFRYKPEGKYFDEKVDEKTINKQNKLADKIEKRIKDNTKYELKETKDNSVKVKLYPWYFTNYSSDLDLIETKLLELAKVELNEKTAEKEETILKMYFAQVKAMEILDNHLENYDNDGKDLIEFDYLFLEENPVEYTSVTLYMNFKGETSKKKYAVSKSGEKLQENRIKEYIDTAIKNKTLDKNNPFKLK